MKADELIGAAFVALCHENQINVKEFWSNVQEQGYTSRNLVQFRFFTDLIFNLKFDSYNLDLLYRRNRIEVVFAYGID